MAVIDVVYHHGGEFVIKEEGDIVYEMEAIDVKEKIDVDTLNVFAMRNHYMALGYEKIEECWWVVPGRPLRTGRRILGTDGELLELVFHVQRNDNKIHLYYEHVVSVPDLVEECPKLIEMNPSILQATALDWGQLPYMISQLQLISCKGPHCKHSDFLQKGYNSLVPMLLGPGIEHFTGIVADVVIFWSMLEESLDPSLSRTNPTQFFSAHHC